MKKLLKLLKFTEGNTGYLYYSPLFDEILVLKNKPESNQVHYSIVLGNTPLIDVFYVGEL